MEIVSFAHRGLRRLVERDDPTGVDPRMLERIRNILFLLQEAVEPASLAHFPNLRIHQLTGNRKGTWSVTVWSNWRITFEYDALSREVTSLNLEDYH